MSSSPVRRCFYRRGPLVLMSLAAIGIALTGCGSPSSRASSPTTQLPTSQSSPEGSSPTTAAAASSPPVTVKIGYQPDLHGAGVLDIGQAEHDWQKFGLKLDMVQFSSGPTEMQAMAGGDIQFGYLGPGAVWLPASGRGTIISVDSLETADWVIGQSNITSVADLKGKLVGYAPGTSGEMILRLALQQAGLTMQDIRPVSLDATAVVPAFLSHHVDAIATWVPLTAAISQTDPQAHFLANDADFSGRYHFPDVWVASRSEVLSHPQVVERFLDGFALANDYRLSHPVETIRLVASQSDVPATGLAAQNKATVWIPSRTLSQDYANGTAAAWLTSLEQLLATMGKLPQPLPVSQFTSFNLFPQFQPHSGGNQEQ